MNFYKLLGNLALFSLFHIIGGIVIGIALHRLRQGFALNAIFFLFWGTIFSLVPLAMGVQTFQEAGVPFLIVVQVIIIFCAIGTAFFVRADFIEDLQSQNVSLILWGSVFFLIGLATGVLMIRDNLFAGLLFLAAFGGAGLFMLTNGLRGLFRDK